MYVYLETLIDVPTLRMLQVTWSRNKILDLHSSSRIVAKFKSGMSNNWRINRGVRTKMLSIGPKRILFKFCSHNFRWKHAAYSNTYRSRRLWKVRMGAVIMRQFQVRKNAYEMRGCNFFFQTGSFNHTMKRPVKTTSKQNVHEHVAIPLYILDETRSRTVPRYRAF